MKLAHSMLSVGLVFLVLISSTLATIDHIHISCPTYVWQQVIENNNVEQLFNETLHEEVALLQTNLQTRADCTSVNMTGYHLNDTGLFVHIESSCVADTMSLIADRRLNKLKRVAESVVSADKLLTQYWNECIPIYTQNYLLPGKNTPNPKEHGRVYTMNVLLSGPYEHWLNLSTNSVIKGSILNDLQRQLTSGRTRMTCYIQSITPRPMDDSRSLPGNGQSGALLEITVTEVLDTIESSYDMLTLNALLSTTIMRQTSETYNILYNNSQYTYIRVLAVYVDLPNPINDCHSVCIIALTILVSMVYLIICTVVVTIVATRCYLITTVDQDVMKIARYITTKVMARMHYTQMPEAINGRFTHRDR